MNTTPIRLTIEGMPARRWHLHYLYRELGAALYNIAFLTALLTPGAILAFDNPIWRIGSATIMGFALFVTIRDARGYRRAARNLNAAA